MKVIEQWIDGVELKPWEIADYWKNVESRTRRGLVAPTSVVTGSHVILNNFATSYRIYCIAEMEHSKLSFDVPHMLM